jgi:hypothetical protein
MNGHSRNGRSENGHERPAPRSGVDYPKTVPQGTEAW